MRHLTVVMAAALLYCALTLDPVRAATPLGNGFTYQGQLKQSGTPVTGTANFQFSLWDAVTGLNQVGSTQTINGVSVTGGLFTVTLNAGNEFGATPFIGDKRWLEITVNGTTLSPRQELTAAPYALFALNAGLFDGLDSSAFLQSIPLPLTLIGTSATHVIRGQNSSTVGGATGVFGESTAASGSTYGAQFKCASPDGIGLFSWATATSGFSNGVAARCDSPLGRGIFGLNVATTGAAYGVNGRSDSTSGRGVFGEAKAASGSAYGGEFRSASTSGIGLLASATATSGATIGVQGSSASPSGQGVFGVNTATSGNAYGVYGRTDSGSGYGVVGEATSTVGGSTGVYGVSHSTLGEGVFAFADSTTGSTYGLYGYARSSQGYGVFGTCPNIAGRFDSGGTTGIGVYGFVSSNSGATKAILGECLSPSGYAVYAAGNFAATGVKSFRIDHPDDPTNKYLVHYSAESPEVINFYSGKVTLDGAGEALVELPRYFAKINKDPRYTLTAVGAPMPMLHVAEEIDEITLTAGAKATPGEAASACSFRIADGAPGKKVSWRVEAVRNDKWVQQRATPVEVEKQGREKGTYQHPEIYGQSPEKGMSYEATRAAGSRPEPPAHP